MVLGFYEHLHCFRDGMGMFSEAYTLFSVGNVKPMFKAEYPNCWGDADHQNPNNTSTYCTPALTSSTKSTEVGGVIAGMITIGLLADYLGRRKGSIISSLAMLIGSVLLVACDGPTASAQFTMYTIGLFIFGFGVGGEYPLAASSAAEKAASERSKSLSSQALNAPGDDFGSIEGANNKKLMGGANVVGAESTRGQRVVLTFSMQGVGNWVNCLVILALLAAFGQTGSDSDLDGNKLEYVWRIQYGVATFVLLVLSYYRLRHLPESEAWKRAAEQRMLAGTSINRWLFIKTYWHRMVGTAIGWLVWDVTFYGNKLFQTQFIAVIEGGQQTVYKNMTWTLVNSSVALVGYYVAAYTIDKRWMGRTRMQNMGFFMIFVLFMASGIWYKTFVDKQASDYTTMIGLFQTLYYLSSFFGQWGPNATTWLLPSEVFPTETRTFAHGISAASGKLGALASGILFALTDANGNALLSDQGRFYISGACGLVGLIVTFLFVPNTTNLELEETDRYWEAVKQDGARSYEGEYNNPKNTSVYERISGAVPKYNGPK